MRGTSRKRGHRWLGRGADIENREVHVELLFGWRSVDVCVGSQSWNGGVWQVPGFTWCNNVIVAFPVGSVW
jgi:hypothetical protein